MGYWSIACHASREVYVKEADVVLGPGDNVFTVVTPNLDRLIDWLEAQGATVRCMHCLDTHEALHEPVQLQAASQDLPS
jgi:hypothetical protein